MCQRLLALMMILLSPFAMAGELSLIGTWRVVKLEPEVKKFRELDTFPTAYWYFLEDGTVSLSVEFVEMGCPPDGEEGTYELKENILTVTFEEAIAEYTVRLSENSLILAFDDKKVFLEREISNNSLKVDAEAGPALNPGENGRAP